MSKNDSIIPVTTVYLGDSGTVVSMISPDAGVPATPVAFSDQDAAVEYHKWGDNDDWPVIARQKIEGSTTAGPLIAQKVGLMFGRGLMYYKEVRTAEGITMDFTPDTNVDKFLLENDINYFLMERLMDFKTGGNLFAEYIFNTTGSEIVSLNHLEGEFCRFGKVDEDSKEIKTLLYKARWDKAGDEAATIDFITQKKFSKEEVVTRFSKSKKFAMHSCLPSPGRTLYAVPPHAAMFKEGGWLDFSNSIPELMSKINNNGMLLKYHIQIPVNYWPDKYSEWDNWEDAKKTETMSAEFDLMDSFLKGKDNAGSAFISHFKVDSLTGKSYDGWKIDELTDPIKKDQFLTSVQEADIQTARCIGLDSSMANIQPQGGKMGAGSGSDKRVGFSNMVTMSYMEQYVILDPLRRVQVINGWDPNLRFVFIHDIPTTLNENKSGVKSELE